jgi:hypothetical protein
MHLFLACSCSLRASAFECCSCRQPSKTYKWWRRRVLCDSGHMLRTGTMAGDYGRGRCVGTSRLQQEGRQRERSCWCPYTLLSNTFPIFVSTALEPYIPHFPTPFPTCAPLARSKFVFNLASYRIPQDSLHTSCQFTVCTAWASGPQSADALLSDSRSARSPPPDRRRSC